MSIRLVISVKAVPGKGNELAAIYREKCRPVQSEPGCLQYEAFQSVTDPDRLVMIEHWQDQETMAAHSARQKLIPRISTTVRIDSGQREDYEYNRTR